VIRRTDRYCPDKILTTIFVKTIIPKFHSVQGSGHRRSSKILNTLQLPHEIVGFSNVQTTIDAGTLLNAPTLHAHRLQATKNKC
jgi:hypothetical protein